jgi:hypothetical protein
MIMEVAITILVAAELLILILNTRESKTGQFHELVMPYVRNQLNDDTDYFDCSEHNSTHASHDDVLGERTVFE